MCFRLESELSVINNMNFSFETLRKHFLLVTYADIFSIEDVGRQMAFYISVARSLESFS